MSAVEVKGILAGNSKLIGCHYFLAQLTENSPLSPSDEFAGYVFANKRTASNTFHKIYLSNLKFIFRLETGKKNNLTSLTFELFFAEMHPNMN